MEATTYCVVAFVVIIGVLCRACRLSNRRERDGATKRTEKENIAGDQ